MRILTNSKSDFKSLISISEADENSPQNIIFCIPISTYETDRINNLQDFVEVFGKGVSTKIKDYNELKTIYLNLEFNYNNLRLTKFTANIKGHKIDFYLSSLNLAEDKFHTNSLFNFDFYYQGSKYRDLLNDRFIILEPNWKQLDELFLKEDIVFVDWEL